MSEVYNDKDTNYDYEEPFDDEMDNEELDDEYEESPENMTLKEKAEAEGMSVREYISEVYFRRGPVGVISGIGFGIIGVIGQAVHVLIKAIVFGEHEKADLWNAFKKYYALSNNKNLDGDTKEEKDQKEVNDKGQENNRSEKATEAQERTRQQVEYEQDSKDAAMSVMLNNQEIAKAFTNIGLSAESQKGTDHILLFKTEHKGNLNLQKTFCAMSKDDLLNKNANSLAAAIFSYHKTDPGKEDEIKLLSTMKAVTAVATVQYLANKEDVENSLINGEQLELSFATIETKNGAADLSIKTSSEYKDMVDIEYNGVAVASMPVSELTEHSFASYQEKLMGPLNKAAEFVYPIQIGTTDRITFNRGTDGVVQVEANGKDLGSYTFETEADVQKLAYKIKANDLHPATGEKTYNVDALVYTAAVVCNPDMQPVRNEKNQILNTFTGIPEPDGKAHFFVEHDENGVRFKLYSPQEGKEFNDVVLNQYVNSQQMYGEQLERLISSVEEGKTIIKENQYIDEDYTRENTHETQTKGTYFDMPIVVSGKDVKETVEEANKEDILEGQQPMYAYDDDFAPTIENLSEDEQDMIAHLESGFTEQEYAGIKENEIAEMEAFMDQQEQAYSNPEYEDER